MRTPLRSLSRTVATQLFVSSGSVHPTSLLCGKVPSYVRSSSSAVTRVEGGPAGGRQQHTSSPSSSVGADATAHAHGAAASSKQQSVSVGRLGTDLYDVFIIGGGVTGTALLYELCKFTGVAKVANYLTVSADSKH